MKNYVLIHGAWHGSWCFNRSLVPKLIEAIGDQNRVFAHDLPGHFNNPFPFKDIDLNKYVESVSDFIKNNIKGDVILVGHSMSGIVISQVAENLSDRISNLVYISGFILPKNGSLLEEVQKSIFQNVPARIKIDKANYSINLDHDSSIKLFYQNCTMEDIEFATKYLQNQPLLPFSSKISLGLNFNNIRKIYIECSDDKAINIQDQRRMNKICDKIFCIDSDHSPFFSATNELVEILASVN
jgi:pimeloyl-ACP methyl ester carboxylesterase